MVRNIVVFLILTLISNVLVWAQNTEVESFGSSFTHAREGAPATSYKIAIGFANNSSRLDASYGDNAVALQEITQFMQTLLQEEFSTRAIVVDGAASPLGKEEYNTRLALRRAQVVRDYLYTIKGSERIRIEAVSNGEDWDSFSREIIANYNHPNRDTVIEIIRSNRSHDAKEEMLRALDNGATYRILVEKHMASARNAAVIRIVELADLAPKGSPIALDIKMSSEDLCLQQKRFAAEQPLVPSEVLLKGKSGAGIDASSLEAAPTTTKIAESDVVRYPVVALRSNLLVPALNFGVEVPIGTNWSVAADYYYPWVWPKRDNKNCFELLAWGIEGRYWFGKERTVFDRLQGHSIGLYGYMGYYDFERNFHGHQGEFANVGVDYTYAMAVGKRRAVHFEFSIGLGFIYSQARKYTVIEANGPLISDKITKTIGFFGPTKANISLVVPIFQRVKPNDKEGRR